MGEFCHFATLHCRPSSAYFAALDSPVDARQARYHAEMSIATDQRQTVLATERSNPDVVGRNRRSCFPEFVKQCRVVFRGGVQHGQDAKVGQDISKPTFIGTAISRLTDAKAVLAQHNDWHAKLRLIADRLEQHLITVSQRRECVRVEDQRHASSSTVSKASAMAAFISAVSSRSDRRAPKCFCQPGFLPPWFAPARAASSACVTTARNVRPSRAACTLASRKRAPGISSVVLMHALAVNMGMLDRNMGTATPLPNSNGRVRAGPRKFGNEAKRNGKFDT